MGIKFPSAEWLEALEATLNSDERYAEIAKNWEGDIVFEFEPEGKQTSVLPRFYMDLWHGKCRGIKILAPAEEDPPQVRFTLSTTRDRYIQILTGRLNPIQAMATRRLKVKGNLGYLLGNVPTVLDFVRCASSIEFDD